MENRRVTSLLVYVLTLLQCSNIGFADVAASRVPAMFVFGDSLVDVGNNNWLNSIARSNYFPYGCDYNMGPTGRFSNGRTVVDMLAEMLGVSYPAAYADPNTRGSRLLSGVNYASAAAGILDESGQHYGERYSLSQQVINFEDTLSQLRTQMGSGNLTDYLSKSIAVLVFGSNDYINNYLMPTIYSSSSSYSPTEFANMLLTRYARQLIALYNVGLRRFFIAGIGPLGCIPNQRSTGQAPPGRCVDYVNQMLGTFNEGLRLLMDQLNRNPGARFIYGNTYGAVGDILNNPSNFGFNVVDRGCCGKLSSEISAGVKDSMCFSTLSTQPAAATSKFKPNTATKGTYAAGRVIVEPYTIYKGKAALSIKPVPPTFTKLDSGSLKVDRKGVMMLTFTPAIGERKYDWEKRMMFALSTTEVGSLINIGPTTSTEFFHDPSMLSSSAGQVRKSLKIKALQDGNGYFVSLGVVNNLLKTQAQISVPVTTAEFTVMKTACSYALPHLMGWNQLTNQTQTQTQTPSGGVEVVGNSQKKMESNFLDSEWDR
ncbi:hypothetical protein ACFE04_014850 [Oxalis oulophora]